MSRKRARGASGRHLVLTILVFSAGVVSACSTIKPYEKEYLLNPLMDDDRVTTLTPSLMPVAAAKFENLGAAGPGSGGATSCPTCGG